MIPSAIGQPDLLELVHDEIVKRRAHTITKVMNNFFIEELFN
jgi:hypothetical protein